MATKLTIGVLIITSMAYIIHLASPIRLTRVLLVAIGNIEKTYAEAIEAGVLCKSDVDTELMLLTLEIKVSQIREATLRDSLSTWRALLEFFKGRTFTVRNCIREVCGLEAHIEKNNYAPPILWEPESRHFPSDDDIPTPLRSASSANSTISYDVQRRSVCL
ncbi:hypothetical protein C8R44DRAFT_879323 [Mycena epipterygia]|nr:hypothetical protein C8R44DRAFT_879323 [Mycena epipterygia]